MKQLEYVLLPIGALLLALTSYTKASDGSYLLAFIGGLSIIYAFIKFGNYDYCGQPVKKGYKIGHYVVCALLILSAIGQYSSPHKPSIYTIIVYGAIIGYLLAYRPSKTSILKKILKVIGYTFFLSGINHLLQVQYLSDDFNDFLIHQTTKWESLMTAIVVMAIGIIFIYFGRKQNKASISTSPA